MIVGQVFVLRRSSEGVQEPDGSRLVTQGALGVFRTLERAKASAAAHYAATYGAPGMVWFAHGAGEDTWHVCQTFVGRWYVIEQCPLKD